MGRQEYLIDTNVAIDYFLNRTIELKKQHKTKLPDAIIAASALVNKLTVITRNTKDFNNIEGLKIINSYII